MQAYFTTCQFIPRPVTLKKNTACFDESIERQHYGKDRVDSAAQDHWIRHLVDQVVVAPDELTVDLSIEQIEALREHDWPRHNGVVRNTRIAKCLYEPNVTKLRGRGRGAGRIRLTLAIQIKRLDGKRMVLSPEGRDLIMAANHEPQPHIVQAIGTAYAWRDRLMNYQITVAVLAMEVGLDKTRIHKMLRLTCLGPVILKLALTGDLPPSVTLKSLIEAGNCLAWDEQLAYLGLDYDSASSRS